MNYFYRKGDVEFVDLTGDVGPSVALDLMINAQRRAAAAEAYAAGLQDARHDLEARVARLERSEAQLMCAVCMDTERQVRFKCGHVCTCVACAKKLLPKQCPVCRLPFKGFSKVMLS